MRPSLVTPGAMAHDRGMPLGRRQQILDAVVDHLHRTAGLEREDRGVARQHRRVFFLAAEAAAGFRLHHPDAIGRQLQQHDQRLVHVVGTLQRSVDRHLAVAGHRDHAVGLDVELLLMGGAIFAFDHEISIPKPQIDIALVDRDLLEAQVGRFDVVVRRAGLVVDRHALVDVDQRVLVRVRQPAGSARRRGGRCRRPGRADRDRSARHSSGRECRGDRRP